MKRVRVILAAVLVLGALSFLLAKALNSSSLYFYEVNEAVDRYDTLVNRSFRVEGVVKNGSVVRKDDVLNFTIEANGVSLKVVSLSEPGGIFQEGIPVVAEGRFAGRDSFSADRIVVKHTEEYIEKNKERLDKAQSQVDAQDSTQTSRFGE